MSATRSVQLGGAPSDGDWLLIDGVANDDNVIELTGGGFVIRVDEEALVVWPGAAHMIAVNGDGYTDLVVRPGVTALDASEGLLGAIDGDPANDPAVDGEPIDLRDRDSLYGVGAPAWLVDDESSLFTYADGDGPETFHDPDAPSVGGPSDDDLDAARARVRRRRSHRAERGRALRVRSRRHRRRCCDLQCAANPGHPTGGGGG